MSLRSEITTRCATAADLAGRDLGRTVRARVAERDGRIVGIAGYYVKDGRAHVFSEMSEQLPKILIWREAVAMMARIRMPAVCIADQRHPGSCRFLARLGWRHAGSSPEGEVYAWRA